MRLSLRNLFTLAALCGSTLLYAQKSKSSDAGLTQQKDKFYHQMDSLNNLAAVDIPAVLRDVPRWDQKAWRLRIYDNCYNFALNIQNNKYMSPGELFSLQKERRHRKVKNTIPLERYIKRNQKLVLKDGLRPLKNSFLECGPGEMPVALFFADGTDKEDRKHDFHWFALRRYSADTTGQSESNRFVWAHKTGRALVSLCMEDDPEKKHIDIFKNAAERGYTIFAGFYAAPVPAPIPSPDY